MFEDPHRPIALVSALRREIEPLWRKLPAESRMASKYGRFARCRLDRRPLILGWTGDGRQAAEDGLRSLFAWQPVDRLIGLGVAGGLSPGLGLGQLVVGVEIRDADGTAAPPKPSLVARALASGGAQEGVLNSSPQILAASRAKRRCWQQLGQPPVATVDLETATWARLAGEHRIPFLGVRAVSDPAEDDLPLDFERYRGTDGRVRSLRVALRALTRPSLIAPLRRLQQRVELCADRLSTWALDFVS
ncbi:MAG: hypothetical protein AAF657_25485, partial [Acidobacteriota bacterium]